MRSKQRTSRQPPTTTQQTTSGTIRLLFLQNTWRKGNNTNPYRHWRGNRHEHGCSCQQQDNRLSKPRPMHPNIPHGMWQSTSRTQQHNPTIRPGGSPHSTAQNNSSQDGRRHYSSTNTNIHIASTRQRRTFSQNTDGTNQNTEVPTTKQLRHQAHKQTSHRSMDGETHSVPAQQVCHTLRW